MANLETDPLDTLYFNEASAPSTPASGTGVLYVKTDGIYFKGDDGTEVGPLGAAGAGGGATLAYAGYDTIGGSTEVMTDMRWYLKKVTTVGAVQLLSVGAHIKWGVDGLGALAAAVFEDAAGSPGKALGANGFYGATASAGFLDLSEASGTRNFRWFDIPVAQELAAATSYWIGFVAHADGTQPSIHYDGSGTDRYWTGSSFALVDAPYFSNTTTTNKYSIRGRTIG